MITEPRVTKHFNDHVQFNTTVNYSLSCDLIPRYLQNLINRLETEYNSKSIDSMKLNDRQVLLHMKSMIPEIGFTAFTHSVIIIQSKS